MMKRNAHEKTMQQMNKKKGNENKNNIVKNIKSSRFLITINVVGSAGPLRFLVNEDDLVSAVIDVALKSYAREGRLPVLGLDPNKFLLYCANAESDVYGNGDIRVLPIFGEKFFESMGEDRVSRRKELCVVQEAGAATNDRSKVRDDNPKGKWLESLA
ncbi:hypothetical protein PTKIN_Ptkin12aG0037200 [Pterospermum kingtungense]